jgi:hypothetical protein
MVQGERNQLLAHLHQTEELLRIEREAADRADARHTQDLRLLREQAENERQLLTERHDAAVRAVTAEALGAQVELIRLGYLMIPLHEGVRRH